MIAKLMGAEIEIITDEARFRPEKSEVERLWASNSKARELTGWTPEYGGLDGFRRGLSETIAWFIVPEHRDSYRAGLYNF
jgi:nucleoside-diphosphate-sugar epimerase